MDHNDRDHREGAEQVGIRDSSVDFLRHSKRSFPKRGTIEYTTACKGVVVYSV